MIGMPVFHGTDRTSSQAYCQVRGEALKLRADVFRREIRASKVFTLMLHKYSQALFALVGQSSACNRIHPMKQRCARWLLHTHDRVGANDGVHRFHLTQQFLSQMLGVRRATVTEAMSALQEQGAIEYQMGVIDIVDRARLEAAACECYAIVRSEFDRLLADHQFDGVRTPNPLDGLKTSERGKSTAGDAVPRGDDQRG
jgi:DNA-binding transcriptional regulator YhcF (GntR family)